MRFVVFALSIVSVAAPCGAQTILSNAGFPFNSAIVTSEASSIESPSKPVHQHAESQEFREAMKVDDLVQRVIKLDSFIAQHPDSAEVPDAFEEIERVFDLYRRFDLNQFTHFNKDASLIHPAGSRDSIASQAVKLSWIRLKAVFGSPELPEFKQACAHIPDNTAALEAFRQPPNVSEDQFNKLRNHAAAVIYGMAGFCEYSSKNYGRAKDYYLQAIQFDRDNEVNLNELSRSYLKMQPIDPVGFWYAARASYLMSTYIPRTHDEVPVLETMYEKYHGSLSGWNEIEQHAATHSAPPAGFKVTAREVQP